MYSIIGMNVVRKFVKVIPKDYKRMMESIQEQKLAGLSDEDAVMSAFQANVAQEKETISTNDFEAAL